MAITIAAILIILGFSFLALQGVLGTFPDTWEWVGIVMAGVGVAMAAPSIFQMFWGRPNLKPEFTRIAKENNRALAVFLSNPPIKNRILKIMGVRREPIHSVEVQFRIQEFGSGEIIDPIRQARLYATADTTDQGNYRIDLPPTFSVGASFMVILWDNVKGVATIPPDRIRNILVIKPGYYKITINISVDGEPRIVVKQFKIGDAADELDWTKSN